MEKARLRAKAIGVLLTTVHLVVGFLGIAYLTLWHITYGKNPFVEVEMLFPIIGVSLSIFQAGIAMILFWATDKDTKLGTAMKCCLVHLYGQLLFLFIELALLMVSLYATKFYVVDEKIKIVDYNFLAISSIFRLACIYVVVLFENELVLVAGITEKQRKRMGKLKLVSPVK